MTDLTKLFKTTEAMLRPYRAIQKQLPPKLVLKDHLQSPVDIQRMMAPPLALRESLRPIIEMQQQWEALRVKTPPWVEEMRRATQAFTIGIAPVLEQIRSLNTEFGAAFQAIARTNAQCQRIEDAGWLPHYTIPFDRLDDANDEDVGAIIEAYYRENWPEVRATFAARVKAYPLDDEAKEAFTEALAAHEAGHYRTATRVLFPEIERVARKEIHGQMTGETSQRALRLAAEELGLSDVEPGGLYAFRLFEKLFDHLYASAKSPEALQAITLDPVPNRHAAMHGFVSYNSVRSSMNMLVMTDFLFQVICAVKQQQEVARAAAAAT